MEKWQFYYNYQRYHSSLNGKTLALAVAEKGPETPFWDDVVTRYDPSKERIREQHSAQDKK